MIANKEEYIDFTKGKAEVVNMQVGKWERLSDEEIMQVKNEFLESYFTQKVVKYASAKHGKFVDVVVTATNDKSVNVIRGLWGKYGHRFDDDYENFMGEIIAGVATAVIQFNESQDTYVYNKMNDAGYCDKETPEERNKCKCNDDDCVKPSREHVRLHAYISKAGRMGISVLESHIQAYTNEMDYKFRSGGAINEMKVESLDQTFLDEDGEETSYLEAAAIEDDILYTYSNYHAPHFVIWFKEWIDKQAKLRSNSNRRIRQTAELTSHQLIYYDVMKKNFIGELVSGVFGFGTQGEQYVKGRVNKNQRYNDSDIYHYNTSIKKAALKAYENEFPEGKTFLQMKQEEEKEILDEVIEIIHTDKWRLSAQNDILSRWISTNYNTQIVQDIIHTLSGEDIGNISAAKMSRNKMINLETLSNFVTAVEKKLHSIETSDNTCTSFYKRDDECREGSIEKFKTANRERTERMRAIKQSDMTVYKKDGTVEVIPYDELPKKKEHKVRQIMPNGAIVERDIFKD